MERVLVLLVEEHCTLLFLGEEILLTSSSRGLYSLPGRPLTIYLYAAACDWQLDNLILANERAELREIAASWQPVVGCDSDSS